MTELYLADEIEDHIGENENLANDSLEEPQSSNILSSNAEGQEIKNEIDKIDKNSDNDIEEEVSTEHGRNNASKEGEEEDVVLNGEEELRDESGAQEFDENTREEAIIDPTTSNELKTLPNSPSKLKLVESDLELTPVEIIEKLKQEYIESCDLDSIKLISSLQEYISALQQEAVQPIEVTQQEPKQEVKMFSSGFETDPPHQANKCVCTFETDVAEDDLIMNQLNQSEADFSATVNDSLDGEEMIACSTNFGLHHSPRNNNSSPIDNVLFSTQQLQTKLQESEARASEKFPTVNIFTSVNQLLEKSPDSEATLTHIFATLSLANLRNVANYIREAKITENFAVAKTATECYLLINGNVSYYGKKALESENQLVISFLALEEFDCVISYSGVAKLKMYHTNCSNLLLISNDIEEIDVSHNELRCIDILDCEKCERILIGANCCDRQHVSCQSKCEIIK